MQLIDTKTKGHLRHFKLKSTYMHALLIVFLFSSCSAAPSDPVASPPLAVQTIGVRTGPIKESIRYVGTVHSRNEIKILSRVAGKISQLPVEEGETAKQGDPLTQITAPEMNARVTRIRADVLRAKEESAFLCQQSQMDQNLLKSDTISKIKADGSLQKCKSSKAGLKAAKAGLSEIKSLAGNTVERAPFDGIVLKQLTETGENTMPGKPILTFGDASLEVRVKVHEKDIGTGIEKGTTIIITMENTDPIRTQVGFVAPMAIGPGRMVEVRIPVTKNDVSRLQHGMSIDVEFILREEPNAVMVPIDSLAQNNGKSGVYLVQDEIAQWKNAIPSIHENGWVAIESDLKPSDRVIVGHLDVVRDGLAVYPVDFERSTQ